MLTYLAVDTDNLSAGGDDSSASRPRYYDTVDDNAQMQSVPSIASGYLKTEPSSTNTAVYNEVAKKLMVCLIILIIKSISQFTRRVFVYDKIWSVIRTILTFITPLIEGCTLYTCPVVTDEARAHCEGLLTALPQLLLLFVDDNVQRSSLFVIVESIIGADSSHLSQLSRLTIRVYLSLLVTKSILGSTYKAGIDSVTE